MIERIAQEGHSSKTISYIRSRSMRHDKRNGMRVCLISMTNIFLCPYVGKYLSYMSSDHSIEFVYWDRHGIEESIEGVDKVFMYKEILGERTSKYTKLKCFIRFKKYCERILSNNNYDRVIILHNYMAVLMYKFLRNRYNHRYLVDIRDYSFEHNKLFYAIEKKAIYSSGMAVISSRGFTSFLPPWDYVLCHNDPIIDEESVSLISSEKAFDDGVIQISFIGLVRFFDQNRKLLDRLGNDNRFKIAYYGQNAEYLQEYAVNNSITNVVFEGRFNPDETVSLYKNTDIINNYYGNHTPVLDYALSNKLYYAAAFKKPILVCEDTYMHELATEYSFGITFDDNRKNAADCFYNSIIAMDREKMKKGCEEFLEEVKKDNEVFRERLNAFLS